MGVRSTMLAIDHAPLTNPLIKDMKETWRLAAGAARTTEHEIINYCATPWTMAPGYRYIKNHRFGMGLAVLDAAFPAVAQAIERRRRPRRPRFGTTTQDRRRIRPSLAGWKRNGA
jgi:hypothetical protein